MTDTFKTGTLTDCIELIVSRLEKIEAQIATLNNTCYGKHWVLVNKDWIDRSELEGKNKPQSNVEFISDVEKYLERKCKDKEESITDAEKHICRSYLEMKRQRDEKRKPDFYDTHHLSSKMKRLVESGAVVADGVEEDKTDEEIWQEQMIDGEPLMLIHHLRENFSALEAKQQYLKHEHEARIKSLEDHAVMNDGIINGFGIIPGLTERLEAAEERIKEMKTYLQRGMAD